MKIITLITLKLIIIFCFSLVFTDCEEDNNSSPKAQEKTNIESRIKKDTVLDLTFNGNALDQSIYKNHGGSYGVHYK